MTNDIKYKIGLKRAIYRIKRSKTHLHIWYFQLPREVKNYVWNVKKDYEIRIANQAENDAKDLFQVYNMEEG